MTLLLMCPVMSRAISRPHTAPDTLAVVALDMEAIRQAVNDSESPFYYPILMERYLSRDTTITTEEYRYLYFGYTFQEDYDPYRQSSHERALDSLYACRNHTAEQCAVMQKYARMVLDDNPFDLRRMSVLVYTSTLTDDAAELAFWQGRIHHILDAIHSTGDGLTPETAWHIIEPEHAYDLLNTLGVMPENYEFRAPCYDYIGVYDLIGNARGFYFNVSRLLEEYHRKYKE